MASTPFLTTNLSRGRPQLGAFAERLKMLLWAKPRWVADLLRQDGGQVGFNAVRPHARQ
jgi:hypothetical protein